MSDSTEELYENQVLTKEVLASCRNHIESLQNLSYLTSLEAESPSQVRLNLRMMEWHIRNLAELIIPGPQLMLPAA
jgi:hypothetical protein